jgi:tryptophan synthase alpha chain
VAESRSSARESLRQRRRAGAKGLIGFLTAGYPDWDRFDAAARAVARAGADVLEVGIPFSDPLADGPTIQASSQRALDQGVTVAQILERIETRVSAWGLPLVFMSYANPILAYGPERFARRAVEAGVSGVLVSDLPPEELPEVWATFRAAGLETVTLVAPTTSPARISLLAASATGFVYCVSRTGVTGKGRAYAGNLPAQIERVRRATELPVAVGFGIRTPEDAVQVSAVADGVVIGARLIELLGEERGSESGAPSNEVRRPGAGEASIEAFVAAVRSALDAA